MCTNRNNIASMYSLHVVPIQDMLTFVMRATLMFALPQRESSAALQTTSPSKVFLRKPSAIQILSFCDATLGFHLQDLLVAEIAPVTVQPLGFRKHAGETTASEGSLNMAQAAMLRLPAAARNTSWIPLFQQQH